eukprot:c51495_g1_i1 orf=61-228(+)
MKSYVLSIYIVPPLFGAHAVSGDAIGMLLTNVNGDDDVLFVLVTVIKLLHSFFCL